MREEDDVERSSGCDREKSNGYTEGEWERTTENVGGSRSARARRKRGLKRAKRGRPSEERGEMGYVAVERERRQGRIR